MPAGAGIAYLHRALTLSFSYTHVENTEGVINGSPFEVTEQRVCGVRNPLSLHALICRQLEQLVRNGLHINAYSLRTLGTRGNHTIYTVEPRQVEAN